MSDHSGTAAGRQWENSVPGRCTSGPGLSEQQGALGSTSNRQAPRHKTVQLLASVDNRHSRLSQQQPLTLASWQSPQP